VEHALRRRLRADRHRARGAERQQRDRKAADDLVQVVVVWSDAVATVAVEVQADAAERYAGGGDHAAGRGADRVGRGILHRREPEMGLKPRHVHVAVVHPAPLRLPVHRLAQLVEPGPRDLGRHEVGGVHDAPALVVHQHGLPGPREERHL
jgi:hypothetical protein